MLESAFSCLLITFLDRILGLRFTAKTFVLPRMVFLRSIRQDLLVQGIKKT